MFSLFKKDTARKAGDEVCSTVADGLKKLYKEKLLPLEEYYKFHDFYSPPLDDPHFDAKPIILLVGQYSTGKTTFIRHLLQSDFPGCRIGPEPTTDRFIVVMKGDTKCVIPGNTLITDPNKQFRSLSLFGNAFINKFQCSHLNNPVLESISIIDTPGILSDEKQTTDRGYNFAEVVEWFAERVDRIILLFDAHKLDTSEFSQVIKRMRGYDEKIRIVLNKADMINNDQLRDVYGALMWSLRDVFNTSEVPRVYKGSFWDSPLKFDSGRRLFDLEEQDLLRDLQSLPSNASMRKLNDLAKRAKLAKVHAYIIHHLKKEMPSMLGKDSKKEKLIQKLDDIFRKIQQEHQVTPGDFPDLARMKEKLQHHDFTKFNALKPKLLETVDKMLDEDIARLMSMIPQEERTQLENSTSEIKGGAFESYNEKESPFGIGMNEGVARGRGEEQWVVEKKRYKYDEAFHSLGPVNRKINGEGAMQELEKLKLPNSTLRKILKLSDIDCDGMLDTDEFALSMYLAELRREGFELPAELPRHLVPPSKLCELEVTIPLIK